VQEYSSATRDTYTNRLCVTYSVVRKGVVNMPAIITGFVKVVNMGSGGVASFGDTVSIMPKQVSKGNFGSGFSSTGDFAKAVAEVSNTNTSDIDVVDANVVGTK
jgi:hypothetical protein